MVEGVEGDMIMLSSGCLCCTIRGELISTLEDLLRRRDNRRMRPFDRVLIETTGLADPAPILNTLMLHPYLSRRFVIDAVVTVVDAVNGAGTLDRHEEARRQVAVADRLVLTKSGLADAASLAALRTRLARLNPAAPLLDAADDGPDAAALLDAGLYAPDAKVPDVARWLNAEALGAPGGGADPGHAHEHQHDDGGDARGHRAHGHDAHDVNRHDERIKAFCLTSETPVKAEAVDLFLQLLRAIDAGKLLRLKGILALAERPEQPMVLHGAQHVVHEPVLLGAWPGGDRRTRLVLIVEDFPEAEVSKLWAVLSDAPAPDRPDRQAMLRNPLKHSAGGLLG